MAPPSLLTLPHEILLRILSFATHTENDHRRPDAHQNIAFYHRTIAHLSACKQLRTLAIDSYYHGRVLNFDLSIARVKARKQTKKVFVSERGTFGDAAEIYGGILSFGMKLQLHEHKSEKYHVDMLMARAKQILQWCTKAERASFEIEIRGKDGDEMLEVVHGNITRTVREELQMVVLDVLKDRKEKPTVQYVN